MIYRSHEVVKGAEGEVRLLSLKEQGLGEDISVLKKVSEKDVGYLKA